MAQAKPSNCTALEAALTAYKAAVVATLADSIAMRWYTDRDVNSTYLNNRLTSLATEIAYIGAATNKVLP